MLKRGCVINRVIVLVCFASACGSAPSPNEVELTAQQFGDRWPFTVDTGIVRCESYGHPHRVGRPPSNRASSWQNSAVTFEADGVIYGVNGRARGSGAYREVDPIWRTAPPLNFGEPVARISENNRRSIFNESVTCEDQASERAASTFPQTNASHPDFDAERVGDLILQEIELAEQLTDECKAGVQERHDLANEELTQIGAEGVANGWPPLSPLRVSIGPIIDAGLELCEGP